MLPHNIVLDSFLFVVKCKLPGTPIRDLAITQSLFAVIMAYSKSSLASAFSLFEE
jgi:hypothetical protein